MESEDTALLRFAADLRRLRTEAGNPTYRELSRRAHYSPATLSEAAGGRRLPSLAVTVAYVTACGGDSADWQKRWRAVIAESDDEAAHDDAQHEEDDQPSPYVGLAAFQPADVDRFFGRDSVVEDLLARVRERRFLGLFGASGAGKSSVLRAGLVARVRTNKVSDGGRQPTLLFTPGPHPLEECAVQLASYTGESVAVLKNEFAADPENLHLRIRQALADQRAEVDLVLVIDQFEEVFTLCTDNEERKQFIAALIFATTTQTSRVRVVLGVRADFYGHCGQHPELVAALRDAQILIGAMTTDELREAITGPAMAADAMVESALVTRLIAEANGQPGVLPLVSHALLETWRRRRGATLTLAAYDATGGIHHAIARTAEHAYTTLSPAQHAIAKQIFLRLTALGEATDDTKRRINRHELDTDDPNTLLVLDKLTQARLIVMDRDGVEIAHEALIRCWPRLHDWLTEDREGLKIHRQLTNATHVWESVDRDPGALYRGTRLASAHDWTATHDAALSIQERRFLDASLDAQAGEQALTVRRTRRLRLVVALLSVLFIAAATATVLAVRAGDEAARERDVAIARKVVSDAAALRTTNPALSVQLALAAYRLAPVPEARDNLLDTVSQPYAALLTGHTSTVSSVAFSPNSHILATASVDHSVRLWDLTDGRHPRHVATLTVPTDQFSMVAFSPDGHTLATSTAADDTARLWDVTDPRHAHELTRLNPADAVVSLAFSPDGRALAGATFNGTIRLWSVADPRHPSLIVAAEHPTLTMSSIALSPDGHTLATASTDMTIRLWHLDYQHPPTELATLTGHTGYITALAFNPDGHLLASGSQDRTARLWNVTDPGRPRELATLNAHTFYVNSVAFSPDLRTLATASSDHTTRLWDLADPARPRQRAVVTGHTDIVDTVAFSPDGRFLATGSDDHNARLENVTNIDLTNQPRNVTSMAFSRDGRIVVTASATTRLWDISEPFSPRALATLAGHTDVVESVTFSPDGATLATASQDHTARLWAVTDPRHPIELAVLTGHTDSVNAVAFTPDGRTLATGDGGGTVRLWNVRDTRHPHQVATMKVGEFAVVNDGLKFSPDGHLLMVPGGFLSPAQLWDVINPQQPRTAAKLPGDPVQSAVFSPDGHTLATGNYDGTARLWDLTDIHKPRQEAALSGHTTTVVYFTAFSPDGHHLATTNDNNTLRLWNITDTHHPHNELILTAHTGGISALAFNPDGHTIATAGGDQTVRLWETNITQAATHICAIAAPTITKTEWNRYFPGVAYQPPCPPTADKP